MSEQPLALRLADALAYGFSIRSRDASAELRRQHCEIEQLKAERDGACKLVAEMHVAAIGFTEGPRRGVVEDITDLKAERDALWAAVTATAVRLRDELKLIKAERDALLVDAERYRWLRDAANRYPAEYGKTHAAICTVCDLDGNALDAAIDAARSDK